MTNTMLQRIVAGTVAGALVLGVPAAALAATTASAGTGSGTGTAGAAARTAAATCAPARLAMVQTAVEDALAARTSTLSTVTGAVGSDPTLTPSDRTTIDGILSPTTAGIAALAQKVPGDTTCAAVAADRQTMVQTYRVFAVVAPQTHLTMAADRAAMIESEIAAGEPKMQAAIIAAQAAGKNVSTADTAYADVQAKLAAAQSSTAGVASTALSQTPASFPGSSAVFVNLRSDIQSAVADFQAVRSDLQTIISVVG